MNILIWHKNFVDVIKLSLEMGIIRWAQCDPSTLTRGCGRARIGGGHAVTEQRPERCPPQTEEGATSQGTQALDAGKGKRPGDPSSPAAPRRSQTLDLSPVRLI